MNPDFSYRTKIYQDPITMEWVVTLHLIGFPTEEEARVLADSFKDHFTAEGMFRAVN